LRDTDIPEFSPTQLFHRYNPNCDFALAILFVSHIQQFFGGGNLVEIPPATWVGQTENGLAQ